MCGKKEDKDMAMPVTKINMGKIGDDERKELIRQSSKKISKKYDKTLRLLSKN